MIDPNELDADGVLYAIGGVVVGVVVLALLIAFIVGRIAGRRVGCSLIASGLVIAVAFGVDVVVVSRALRGDVTGWDIVWAAGLTTVASWSLWRLRDGV